MPVQSNEEEQVVTLDFIKNEIINNDHEYLIFGGDLNIHLDPILDKGNLMEKKIKNIKARNKLSELLEDSEITDILRVKNEGKN